MDYEGLQVAAAVTCALSVTAPSLHKRYVMESHGHHRVTLLVSKAARQTRTLFLSFSTFFLWTLILFTWWCGPSLRVAYTSPFASFLLLFNSSCTLNYNLAATCKIASLLLTLASYSALFTPLLIFIFRLVAAFANLPLPSIFDAFPSSRSESSAMTSIGYLRLKDVFATGKFAQSSPLGHNVFS